MLNAYGRLVAATKVTVRLFLLYAEGGDETVVTRSVSSSKTVVSSDSSATGKLSVYALAAWPLRGNIGHIFSYGIYIWSPCRGVQYVHCINALWSK